MRTVFMGTPGFAVPSLSALAEAGHEVVLVVTRPDRPRGRGLKPAPPPVKARALELGLPVIQPERIRAPEAVEAIAAAGPEAAVVAAFGQMLPRSVLDVPPLGCINVHASLLPRYRGAAPINWAIINGETTTGVTIMRMDEGMDAGLILLAGEEPIRPDDTAGSLAARLSMLGAGLLIQALGDIQAGRSRPVAQESSKATYAPMLRKGAGHIGWTKDAVEIERLVRGLDPWPGAYFLRGGETVKVWRARVYGETLFEGGPGEVVDVNRGGIKVMTGGGVLVVTELQRAGGRRMGAREFLAGHRVSKGERFV